ncbi:MAG: peptidylprolyl isomerase [Alistipes sp.]|nr:peptidylprolyl isomerase [Alistipes sp.]
MKPGLLLSAFPALLCLVAGSGSAAAQSQVMADKVAAVVGNSMILYSDLVQTSKSLIEQRRQQGYTSDRDPLCEALETLIEQKILYNQAQIDSLNIDTGDIAIMVENTLSQEIAEKGSQAAVELYYHKPIFDIRSDLQERYEEMRYAGRMRQEIRSKSSVTSGEVERFFKHLPKDSLPIIHEQYVYSQIVRYPPSTEDAKFRTRERMLELRERIMNGTKFEVLARMYSEDPGSAIRGGEMDPMPKESFVQPFADALAKLKPGQISEVVETEFGYHLILLLDQVGNLYHCRHILLKPQFTDSEIKAAFTTLDSLKQEILAGKLTFADAVAKYSEDKYSNRNGGVATNIELLEAMNQGDARAATTKFLKEELSQTPEVYNALKDMKPGDISDAFASQDMRGNILGKIVRLDEIIPTHTASLSEDFLKIEEIALKKKQDADFETWLKNKVAGMFIRVDSEFRSCQFERPYLLK